MEEKSYYNQEEFQNYKETTKPISEMKLEKSNCLIFIIKCFFEHLTGFILMVIIIAVCSSILAMLAGILMISKGVDPNSMSHNQFFTGFVSRFLWVIVGATIPGSMAGVSLHRVPGKSDGSKLIRFRFIPFLFGMLLFPGLLAFLSIEILKSFLFHFDSSYLILVQIFFGIILGFGLWFRVVHEWFKLKASRSWL